MLHDASPTDLQRLRATIFDIADGERRRNAAMMEGQCPIFTALITNSRRAAVIVRT
jgi:hypothetical protein